MPNKIALYAKFWRTTTHKVPDSRAETATLSEIDVHGVAGKTFFLPNRNISIRDSKTASYIETCSIAQQTDPYSHSRTPASMTPLGILFCYVIAGWPENLDHRLNSSRLRENLRVGLFLYDTLSPL